MYNYLKDEFYVDYLKPMIKFESLKALKGCKKNCMKMENTVHFIGGGMAGKIFNKFPFTISLKLHIG